MAGAWAGMEAVVLFRSGDTQDMRFEGARSRYMPATASSGHASGPSKGQSRAMC